jgi:hypothetical protein
MGSSSLRIINKKLTGDPMLGPEVTGITLVYAEKVKFIAFTFPAAHRARIAPYAGI